MSERLRIGEGLNGGKHGAIYDISKREVATNMRAPSKVRRTSSIDAKKVEDKVLMRIVAKGCMSGGSFAS